MARGEKSKLKGELRGACARERRPIDNVGGGSTVPMTNWEEENKAKDVKDVKDDGFMASKLSLKARRRRIGMYTERERERETVFLYRCPALRTGGQIYIQGSYSLLKSKLVKDAKGR